MGLKRLEKLVRLLPYLILMISLAQVIGFIAIGQPFLVGAWSLTAITSLLAIIYGNRWINAEDRARAEKAVNDYLTQVIVRHVDSKFDPGVSRSEPGVELHPDE